jgi:hypothetical protein
VYGVTIAYRRARSTTSSRSFLVLAAQADLIEQESDAAHTP